MISTSTSAFIHVLIETNYTTWFITQTNKATTTGTTLNSQVFSSVQQSTPNIMWFRFLLIIVIFVTAAGNILVCLAITRERKLQNTTNYFLMSLAIADCMVALLVMPMGMVAEAFGYFPLPHYCCVIFATADVLCCTSSIWHMSTMSMDRYFTIRFPFRYGRNKTKRIMLLKIIAVWAISLAVSSPVFVLGIVDRRNVLINGICAPNNATFKAVGGVFAFYIPFIIMIVTYALTMRSLRDVLVHKRRYNRERRRDQTFRPLATIINQYAEIAHGLRQTGTTMTTTTKTVVKKTPYTVITTTTASPIDKNHPFFFSSNGTLLMDHNQKHDISQYGSFTTANGQVLNISPTGINSLDQEANHLMISYIKQHHSKKKQYDVMYRKDCDMSTVYEMTEFSKSSSGSDYRVASSCLHQRRSVVIVDQTSAHVCEQQPYGEVKNKEGQQQQQQLELSTNQLKEVIIIENQIPSVEEEIYDELPPDPDTNINETSQSSENIHVANNSVCLTTTSISIENCAAFIMRLIELFYRYYYVNNRYQFSQQQLNYRNVLPIEYFSHNKYITETSPTLSLSDTTLKHNNPSSNIYQNKIQIDATYVNNQTTCTSLSVPIVLSEMQTSQTLSTNNYILNNERLDDDKHHQSTSMSYLVGNKQTMSVSTQTDHSYIPKSLSSFSDKPCNQQQNNDLSNRTKGTFSFSKHFLCTSFPHTTSTRSESEDERISTNLHSGSLFTNFFKYHKSKRSSSNTGTGSGAGNSSTKSSLSWGQHSSSSYHQQKSATVPHHHSSLLKQIECEMDSVLAQQRSRGSSASSLFFNNKLHRNRKRRRKRRPFVLSNSHNSPGGNSLRQQQIYSSSTSSSTYNSETSTSRISRFLSSQRQQQQHHLQQQQHHLQQQQQQEKIVAQNERKALRVLLIIFCVFVTLWTPFFICTFISAVCDKCREKIPSIMWFWITWLGYTSSMANPLVYTIFSDAFRRAFTNLLCCRSSDSMFAHQLSTKSSYPKGAIFLRHNGTAGCSGTSTPIGREREQNNNQEAIVYVNKYNLEAIR